MYYEIDWLCCYINSSALVMKIVLILLFRQKQVFNSNLYNQIMVKSTNQFLQWYKSKGIGCYVFSIDIN